MPPPLLLVAFASVFGAAPLALVNAEPITGAQVLADAERRYGGLTRAITGEADVRNHLEAAIERRLLFQEARRLGVVDDPAVAGPVKEFEQQTAARLLYAVEVSDKSRVTDADVKQFFETRTEDVFAVRQLVTRTQREAEALRGELVAGTDFAKLARERSTVFSKMHGGLLENLGWGSREAAWEEVAYRLERGALSPVLQTKEGFEVLRLEDAKKVPRPDYARVEKRIRAILATRESEARRAAFHQELWAKYAVREPRVVWSYEALKDAVATRATTEVGTWTGGRLTLAGFGDRIHLDLVAAQPPDYQAKLELLRHEVVRQEIVKLEVAARGLAKVREVADAVDAYRAELVEAKHFDEFIAKGVTTAPDEVRKYFEGHRAEFTRAERRHLLQIVVPTEKKAADTLKKLAAGAKFEALARTLSIEPESARMGGELGWVTAAQTPPEFSSVLALKQGDVSAPIQTGFGFHLIKVVEVTPSMVPAFGPVQEEVAQVVLRRKLDERRAALVRTLRSAAVISVDAAAVKAFVAGR